MSRYGALDVAQYNRMKLQQQQQQQYEDYNLAMESPSLLLDSAPRHPFRSSSEAPYVGSSVLSDEWSATTLPDESLPHMWQQDGLRYEKKARLEQPQDSLYEYEQQLLLQQQQQQQQQQRVAARGYIAEENLQRIQALQRQGNALNALEANQRLMQALYASRQQQQQQQQQQSPTLYEQKIQRAQLLDAGLLRQYNAVHGSIDPLQQQQPSPLPPSALHNLQLPVSLNQPLFHTPYQQQQQPVYSPSQTRLPNHVLKLQAMEAAYLKCSQVVSMFVQEQRQKPRDNTVQFWRSLFKTFFAEGATQRWCLSCYNSSHIARHAQGLFPLEHWRCNLCGAGRGFDARVDVLPRLSKIKFDSGLLEELFFLEVPDERQILPSGNVVFEYSRAIHESSFAEVRIIKHGRLRVTFNSFFKICSWEFCTKTHEDVIPRSNLLPEAHHLAGLVREVEKEGLDTSLESLKYHCNEFNQTAKQLAMKLEAPSVNDLGFSKRYIRCVQIAEVVDSMEDLITFAKATGLGPIESLIKFPHSRKRQHVEEESPQSSSITHLPYPANVMQQSNGGNIPRLPSPGISYNQLPPEVRAQLLQQQSMMQQSLSRGELRSKIAQAGLGLRQQQQQQMVLKTSSAHSNQSLPGTPQSEMSDLRSNAC